MLQDGLILLIITFFRGQKMAFFEFEVAEFAGVIIRMKQ